MVFRGRDSSRARGRSRPFRFRGRGARRPYGRGSSRGGHDGKREEGLRITLRNVDAASYNRRDKSWSDDRESDRFDKYGEDYDDYDNYDKEKRDRRTPSRESRNSPPRKRQHIESDLLEDESLRITVGNDLYKKEGRSPSTDKQGSHGDRPQYAEGEVWEGRGDREEERQARRDESNERRYGKNYDGFGKRTDFDSPSGSKPYYHNRNPEEGSRGRGRPYPQRGFERGRGRGRGGDGSGFRDRRNYSTFERPQTRSERYSRSPSHERRRSRSYSRERHSGSMSYRRPRSRSYSRERRNYSHGRRSYSHGRRSSSRDWRSSSRGRSHGRTRSHSRERSYTPGSRSPRRSSVGRSRSLPRSYSPGRRTSRSHSRGRSGSLRRSHSRSRGYSRSPRSYSRSSSQSGGRGHSRSRSGSIARRYHRSPVRRGSRDSGTGRRDSVDRRSVGRSRSSSSSSSSGSSKGHDNAGSMSEKEYEEEMFRRLKSELTSNYSNPSEREERIAKHIREMAKISPVLFRNFMSKNAGNLAALTLSQEQEEEKPVDADTGANQSPVSDPSQAKPLRSILKRKEGSLSPSRAMETEHLGEQPMSNIEKVIHSLRKGSGALEKEAASSAPPQTVALKHLSSYMDIEDEEEFLYGEDKSKKENPGPAVPFWSAHRFEEDTSKADLDLLEEHPRSESEQEASKTSSKTYESINQQKSEDVKRPSVFDDLEDKEKIYEQWRATMLQKGKKEGKDDKKQGAESNAQDQAEASDLSSTVKNILESIGFNFDLSRRMQELARQKKEQEQADPSLAINQTASFLGSTDLASSFKTNIFQQEAKSKANVKADVASLVEEVRQATRLAQEKAKKAKEQEERHMNTKGRDRERSRESLPEPELQKEIPQKEAAFKREPELGDGQENYMLPPAVYPYNTFGVSSSYETYLPSQQYNQYHGYGSYSYFPAPEEEYVPDYEDPHQPKPVRTSNLISLAGDVTQSEAKTRQDELSLRPNDRADVQPKDPSKLEKKQGEVGLKKPMERIFIMKKQGEGDKGDFFVEETGFSRRIVLPPKDKQKPAGKQMLGSDSPKEAPKRTESLPSSASDSSNYRDTKRRGSSPDLSLRHPKQSRLSSPEYEKKDSKKESEAFKSLGESQIGVKDSNVDSEAQGSQRKAVISVAREKARVLMQEEERRRKVAVLQRELCVLKQQHNDLLRKRRRQTDGHKDPLLAENLKLQEEINAQIYALERGRDVTSSCKSPSHQIESLAKNDDYFSAGLSEGVRKKEHILEVKLKQKQATKDVPKIRYEYFDPGSHWCRLCNVICGHMFDFFKHLESKKHQQRLDPFERPWLIEALQKSEGKVKEGPVQAHAIKGLEFMMATSAFYCSLCKEFAGDLSVAESHMKSDEHHEKYREYIAQNPFYEKRYTLERSASLTLQKSSSAASDEESSDGEEEKQTKPKKKSSVVSQFKDESHQSARDSQERMRKESCEKQQDNSSKSSEAEKRKSRESRDSPLKDTSKNDGCESPFLKEPAKAEKKYILKDEEIPLPQGNKSQENNSEKKDILVDEEKKEDTESKGKIPIKLTGKSGIKPPAPPPVQSWKAITRPIPKSKRFQPVKPLPAVVSGNSTQPAPLDEFLTLGTKTSQPLPIVKEASAAIVTKALLSASQPVTSAATKEEQAVEPVAATVLGPPPEPLPPGTYPVNAPSAYAQPPVSSGQGYPVPPTGGMPVSLPPMMNLSMPPPVLQPPSMMPCGPPVSQHGYQGPYPYYGPPMMGPAPWPPMMGGPPPMNVCPPAPPQPPLPPYSSIPPLPPISAPAPPLPPVSAPPPPLPPTSAPPPPLPPTSAPPPPPPPPPASPEAVQADKEAMQTVEQEPPPDLGEKVQLNESEQAAESQEQLPSFDRELPHSGNTVTEVKETESAELLEEHNLWTSAGEKTQSNDERTRQQDIQFSPEACMMETEALLAEKADTFDLKSGESATVDVTAAAMEETSASAEETTSAVAEESYPVAEESLLVPVDEGGVRYIDETPSEDVEMTDSFCLDEINVSREKVTSVPPVQEVVPSATVPTALEETVPVALKETFAVKEALAPVPIQELAHVVVEDIVPCAASEGVKVAAAEPQTAESSASSAAAEPSTSELAESVEDKTTKKSPSPTRRPKTRSQTRTPTQNQAHLQTRYPTRRSQKAADVGFLQPPEEEQVTKNVKAELIRPVEESEATVASVSLSYEEISSSFVATCSKEAASSSVVESEADMSSETEGLHHLSVLTRSRRSAAVAHIPKESNTSVPEKHSKLPETTHCVLDLTKPPVDSSVSCEDDVEVESSSSTAAESLPAANNEAIAALSPADSEASDDTIIVESSEAMSSEVEAQLAKSHPSYTEIDPEESALNLTIASPILKAGSCRSVVQTEPEDLRAPAMPQDLSTSGCSRSRAVLDMPMDLSVRLATSESAASLLSISTTMSEDVQAFSEAQSSPPAPISSSDILQRTDSMDSSTVKDTLLCGTSGFGPSSSRLSLDQELALEASLIEDQSNEMPGSSPGLGVDAEGDPVDFSLAPIDFEELADLDDAHSAAPVEDNGERDEAVDSTYPDMEETGV